MSRSTDKKLEEVAREVWMKKHEMAEPKYCGFGSFEWFSKGLSDGANYVKELASEGFEEWVESEDTRMHPDGREGYFANNNNFTRDHWIAEKAWQAATLSSQKRIKELEKKLEIHFDKIAGHPTDKVAREALHKIKGES
jgi:hypothetical protein